MGKLFKNKDEAELLKRELVRSYDELTEYRNMLIVLDYIADGETGKAIKYILEHNFKRTTVMRFEKAIRAEVDAMLQDFLEKNPQYMERVHNAAKGQEAQ